jgi:tetratricopeptide (TPR) repeat protein
MGFRDKCCRWNTSARIRKFFETKKTKNTIAMAGSKRDLKRRPPPLAADTLAKFLERATQLHGEGRFDEAARHYEHIQACNPDVLAAPYFLALMDLETGFLERALEGLRLVTRKDPGSFDAVFALAHTFQAWASGRRPPTPTGAHERLGPGVRLHVLHSRMRSRSSASSTRRSRCTGDWPNFRRCACAR